LWRQNDEHIGLKRALVRLIAFPSVFLVEMEVILPSFQDLTDLALCHSLPPRRRGSEKLESAKALPALYFLA
jgi:hypothetical protein